MSGHRYTYDDARRDERAWANCDDPSARAFSEALTPFEVTRGEGEGRRPW